MSTKQVAKNIVPQLFWDKCFPPISKDFRKVEDRNQERGSFFSAVTIFHHALPIFCSKPQHSPRHPRQTPRGVEIAKVKTSC